MKVTCDREKLWHAFQTASGVAPSRSPKPILQNVKMEVTARWGNLDGHGLGEWAFRIELSGLDVQAPGSVVLPTGRFGSILRESSDEKSILGDRRSGHGGSRRTQRVSSSVRESR